MKLHISVLLLVLFLLAAPAAAQEAPGGQAAGNATADTPDGAPEDVLLAVDEHAVLVDKSFDDGELELTFWANESVIVHLSGEPEGSGAITTYRMQSYRLKEDTTTTVTIETAGDASVWTDSSLPEAYKINKPSGAIIPPPYTGSDIAYAMGGTASLFALGLLYQAVQLKLAGSRRGERVA